MKFRRILEVLALQAL